MHFQAPQSLMTLALADALLSHALNPAISYELTTIWRGQYTYFDMPA
jgi:hypothetical protein